MVLCTFSLIILLSWSPLNWKKAFRSPAYSKDIDHFHLETYLRLSAYYENQVILVIEDVWQSDQQVLNAYSAEMFSLVYLKSANQNQLAKSTRSHRFKHNQTQREKFWVQWISKTGKTLIELNFIGLFKRWYFYVKYTNIF